MIDRSSISDALFGEVHSLTAASLSGDMNHAQMLRLTQLLQGPVAMDLYLDMVWESSTLNAWAKCPQPEPAPTQPDAARPIPTGRSPVLGFLGGLWNYGSDTVATTTFMWFVMAIVCSGIAITIIFCGILIYRGVGVHDRRDAPQVADTREPSEEKEGRGTSKDESAIVHPSSIIPNQAASSATVARLIHTADCHWAIGSHSPHLGDDLEPGRKLVLLSGLAEIMFQSGVRTLLQGPATMEIGSRSSTRLDQGKLTVRVEDPDARGFAVYTPGMKYTDLGTEFGVWVAKNGAQEMVVFRGKVAASREEQTGSQGLPSPVLGRGDEGEGNSHLSSLILSANQAIRVAGADKTIERIAGEKRRFIRAMPTSAPFGLCGTGLGLARGAVDPHWELTSISTEPGFKPQAAVVANPLPIYLRPGKGAAQWPASQWIGRSQALKRMPDACRCTFRTHFDLAGFDAPTAHIEGRLLVDDYVAQILLNGKVVPLPVGARGPYLFAKWLEFKIDEGFVAGDNILEIVAENSSNAQQGYVNTVALCVECKGTALPMLILPND
jgi:hypothetical protein